MSRAELLTAAGVAIAALLPLLFARPGVRRASLLAAAALPLLLAGHRLSVYRRTTFPLAANRARLAAQLPEVDNNPPYVSSNQCQSCHVAEHASWHRSYHRTMTQVATPENVVGDFDGTELEVNGLRYRVFRRGDQFWAEMPDPDELMKVVQGGKPTPLSQITRLKRPVVLTTGSHHYQTYWVSSAQYETVLQTLPLVYLIGQRRWIPREAAFMHPPGPEHMITQWNHHCIRCHSTGGNPGLDLETGQLHTRVGEFGIACEACHGPGQEHIRANRDPLRRYRLHLSGAADPTIVNPARLDHRAASQVCGQCHGVYTLDDHWGMKYATDGSAYRPGRDLHTTRHYIQFPREGSPQRLEDTWRKNRDFFRARWWDDGTVLAGGREYTALLDSACYTRGEISCLSCHTMHGDDPDDQLWPGMRGDQACTQCHQEPTYTAVVDKIHLHSHHRVDSEGSRCMNCHMPHTTYALLKGIRNHQIASPQIASSIRQGTPNACNLCHLDRSLSWTQQAMQRWYGHSPLPLSADQRQVAASLLWLLQGDAAQRVIAAWHVGWKPAHQASGADWLAPFGARLLEDPYGVVRYVAHQSLKTLPGFGDFPFDFLAPEEQRRARRIEATQRWQALTQGRVAGRAEQLIDPQGGLMAERIEELMLYRDNRPVTISE